MATCVAGREAKGLRGPKGQARETRALQTPNGAGSSLSALVPIADGSEEMEAVITADVLVRGGVSVTLASAKTDKTLQCTMSRGVRLVADKRISECVSDHFDAVAIPGGAEGAQNLAESESLDSIVREQFKSGRLLCAICAAPVVTLTPKGVMDSLHATAHPSFSEHLPDPSCQQARVMKDGNVITSRAPGTAFEFALCIIEELRGMQAAKDIMPGMVLPNFKTERSFGKEWLAAEA
ncbi:DJ-1 family protein [Candidatus Saccharibacteria bacterium SW_7_54_9]|nr:MAG: DJ-1 family protein [Candidatus Saccharibacteria bacterium SW_7_54_9]